MNDKEKLESHKRMYLWIQEQAKKNRWLSEDDRTDWIILNDSYSRLLNLIEDLISDLEEVVNKNEKDKWKERLPIITISNEVPE